ncbi:alpha/beta hydrolase [Caulobacter sp. 17J65-9]|uniref:alpha/beta hydrolase family protein n=1 Tax=Caulobacter sp. 17J65-9 TaxID=2709382 RepID=UPI0013CBF8F2|nr:alpha/beta hydrolase [Caulobacter sp. 17J65-9]NEX92846.1 alpha/beta fold hydrolase [Caulobacter sp. 17J65-9]
METNARAEDVTVRPIQFAADDGHPLAGVLIAPVQPTLAALITPATGYPKEFYLRFAKAWAARGCAVLVFDCRGVGGSAPDDLKRFSMDYTDWGRLDMPAALDALAEAAPGRRIVHVGHSAGGQFVGFMRNHERISRHAFVAVGSGYGPRHHLSHRPREVLFWWGYGPACLATKGYIPAGGIWGGTALPRGVFTTWRRWSHQSRYFAGELDRRFGWHRFGAVTAPIRSWTFADDPIATPAAARDILELFPNAPTELIERRPRDYRAKRLGHDGAFRAAGQGVWAEVWDWLEADAA